MSLPSIQNASKFISAPPQLESVTIQVVFTGEKLHFTHAPSATLLNDLSTALPLLDVYQNDKRDRLLSIESDGSGFLMNTNERVSVDDLNLFPNVSSFIEFVKGFKAVALNSPNILSLIEQVYGEPTPFFSEDDVSGWNESTEGYLLLPPSSNCYPIFLSEGVLSVETVSSGYKTTSLLLASKSPYQWHIQSEENGAK
ncbi:hypothetical protein [Vibrio sp. D431a]|uniref:hypothetical protein n=1 Tax=Vibrio sp. D431a TaxID=2837388 RepID=UPI002552F53C|nr:hypothetical protein [Vibrio sp. D431a]MDK9790075.1 hypothetical protein [Vibrio sp. D431a]